MGDLEDKSLEVAARVKELCGYLQDERQEISVSEQLLASGTGIGVNLQEAMQAQGGEEYSNKIFSALKETISTLYWTDRLRVTGYISTEQRDSVRRVCEEIESMLLSIVKNQ